jgi:hypothetical protein
MKMPPMWLYVRVVDQGRTKVRLWLPLILLWLLLLPLLVLAVVMTVLIDLLTLPVGSRFGFTRLLFGVLGTINAVRGTEVHIDSRDPKHPDASVAFTLR